jgi:bifunctional non-homologous end joining protein LigD
MPSRSIAAAGSALPPALHLPEPYASRVLAHYERVAPLLATSFAGTPLISVYYPGGFGQPESRIGRLTKPVPSHIETIPVRTRSGDHRYVALEANALLWRVHAYAVEFESWSPTATNPLAVAFARILLVPSGAATQAMVKEGCVVLRDLLSAAGLQPVLSLDGLGAAIWIPFDDAPASPAVRAWLHERIAEAAQRHPALFSVASGAEAAGRIHLSVRTNAPGQGSILPYSLRGTPDLPMATPIRWDEVETFENGAITATSSAARLDAAGDVFAEIAAAIDGQSFARVVGPGRDVTSLRFLAPAPGRPIPEYMPRARVITVALQILADGRPRTAQEILDAALAKGLLPQPADRMYLRKYIYVMLKEYAEKTKARGRKPLVVQDSDRRFHVNHAPDDWPDPAAPVPSQAPADLIARLRTAATGDDPRLSSSRSAMRSAGSASSRRTSEETWRRTVTSTRRSGRSATA